MRNFIRHQNGINKPGKRQKREKTEAI